MLNTVTGALAWALDTVRYSCIQPTSRYRVDTELPNLEYDLVVKSRYSQIQLYPAQLQIQWILSALLMKSR